MRGGDGRGWVRMGWVSIQKRTMFGGVTIGMTIDMSGVSFGKRCGVGFNRENYFQSVGSNLESYRRVTGILF